MRPTFDAVTHVHLLASQGQIVECAPEIGHHLLGEDFRFRAADLGMVFVFKFMQRCHGQRCMSTVPIYNAIGSAALEIGARIIHGRRAVLKHTHYGVMHGVFAVFMHTRISAPRRNQLTIVSEPTFLGSG